MANYQMKYGNSSECQIERKTMEPFQRYPCKEKNLLNGKVTSQQLSQLDYASSSKTVLISFL